MGSESYAAPNEWTEMKPLSIAIAVSLIPLLSGCHHLEVDADVPDGSIEPHVHIEFNALEVSKK